MSGSHLTRQHPLGSQSQSLLRQRIPLAFRGVPVPARTVSWESIVHISSKLCIQGHHINSLKAAMVGVFLIWKLTNCKLGLSPPLKSLLWSIYQHITVRLLSPMVTSQCSFCVTSGTWWHHWSLSLFGSTLRSTSRRLYFSNFSAHSLSFLWYLNMEWLGFRS